MPNIVHTMSSRLRSNPSLWLPGHLDGRYIYYVLKGTEGTFCLTFNQDMPAGVPTVCDSYWIYSLALKSP